MAGGMDTAALRGNVHLSRTSAALSADARPNGWTRLSGDVGGTGCGPGADGDPLGGTTSNFISVITYCRDHTEYCRKNPDKLAMRYWVG